MNFDVGSVGFLDKNGMPMENGAYLVKENGVGDKNAKVYVYPCGERGLCCYCDDLRWFDMELPDEYSDGHVPVNYADLVFVAKVGELKVE